MGKGDRRTRRGKIYAGSFGKSRPKSPKAGKGAKTARPVVKSVPAPKPAARPAARKKTAG